MACDPQTLVSAVGCQFNCLSGKMLAAIRIRLLCAIVDKETMACDAQTLIDNAKCIESCVPNGMMAAIEIYLLCQIATNTASGASGSTLCGVADPITAPTTTCAIYYRTDNGAVWYWSGSAWIQLIAP